MDARSLNLGTGRQDYHESGQGSTLVLLHGISSGAPSWEPLAGHLPGYRLLAWDAPGYGRSTPLVQARPDASDYARRLDEWLTALDVTDCILVGHSLGALMASGYLANHPDRVRGVVLADPARGYKHEPIDLREQVFRSRWPQLAELGHERFAGERAPRLLCDQPTDSALGLVRQGMRRLNLGGFQQSNWLLANDDLVDWWRQAPTRPAQILCGDEDRITTPDAVRALAETLELPYRGIPQAGHAAYIDQPQAFAQALDGFVRGLPND
ncbi:alpha/beta fold hydrolase [Saccharospirillum salsuginis]|uniref:Alpha/beta hydrolase n=1 Tax=Saccharospirillum salsuginis TaxID=418750 RepID=A0A918K3K1_9GAMM|nr:alpha/beta hydrolase [Saccharospirillum salsuginis]GGX45208.1 alpha/beta hydrolase [Saccharospirillum salsuginis]